MIATSVNQSKKLIELGIDVNTADMYWEYDSFQGFHRLELFEDGFFKTLNKDDIPAWSLSALTELLSYGDILCVGKAAKDDGYLWISPTQSLPNNPLVRDNDVYPSVIDMILDRYIYPYLGQKKVIDIIYGNKEETECSTHLPL